MKQYPEPIVSAFIFNSEGELLLIKSHKWKGMYTIPGGHMEIGETLEQALKREVKEEAGIEINNIKLICILDYMPDGDYWKKKQMIFINYLARTSSKKITLNEEAQEYLWIKPAQALKLPMGKETKSTIKNILEKNYQI